MFKNNNILGFYNCISCGKVFGQNEIKTAITLKKSSQARLTYLTCKKCGSSTLLGLIEGKVSGLIGLATDLTAEDLKNKQKNQTITTNDVLKFNNIINRI